MEAPLFDPAKTRANGKKFMLTSEDSTATGSLTSMTSSGGISRAMATSGSPEVKALRDEADIVITNPPFSLFREFIAWVVGGSGNSR